MLRPCTQDYSGTVVLIREDAGILLARVEAIMLADDEELGLFGNNQVIKIPDRLGDQGDAGEGHIASLIKAVAPTGENKLAWYALMRLVVEAIKSGLKAKSPALSNPEYK